MALTLADHQVRPMTADEVLRMVKDGILGEDEPVELLQGVLVQMSPKSSEHALVMARLLEWLAPLLAARTHHVRSEHPLVVPDHTSLPEPDLAVVERSDELRHPTTALLVIEVSVSSRAIDTQIKPGLYASAGVPDYWVVDVPRRRLEVRRDPAGGEYGSLQTIQPGEKVAALGLELPPLHVGELLTGL